MPCPAGDALWLAPIIAVSEGGRKRRTRPEL